MRAFLAVEIPQEVREALGDVIRHLRGEALGVKWVRPEQIHLTLEFYADLPPESLSPLEEAVSPAALAFAPAPLRVRGLGAFRSGGKIRVLWAGIEDPGNHLAAFAGGLREALWARGIRGDDKPFRPHLTLGRLREPSRNPALERALSALGDFQAGPFVPPRLTLFESTLAPEGPIHLPLRRWPLGGAT